MMQLLVGLIGGLLALMIYVFLKGTMTLDELLSGFYGILGTLTLVGIYRWML